jgi:two-component sensor histidine kinase
MSTLGILVNEVVTNSMKYAFQGREAGLLRVEARREAGSTLLVIADHGAGLPASINLETPETFGFLLVTSLARQLDAALSVEGREGTRIRLSIPDAKGPGIDGRTPA